MCQLRKPEGEPGREVPERELKASGTEQSARHGNGRMCWRTIGYLLLSCPSLRLSVFSNYHPPSPLEMSSCPAPTPGATSSSLKGTRSLATPVQTIPQSQLTSWWPVPHQTLRFWSVLTTEYFHLLNIFS